MRFSGKHTDGQSPSDDFAVGGQVGFDIEQCLRTAEVDAEAGNELVENQGRAVLVGDGTEAVEKFAGSRSGKRDCRGSTRMAANSDRIFENVERLGAAVIEHEHILDRALRDARGNGNGA